MSIILNNGLEESRGRASSCMGNTLNYPRLVPIDRGIKIWADDEGNLKSSALGLDNHDIRLLQSMKAGDQLKLHKNSGEEFYRLYRPMSRVKD